VSEIDWMGTPMERFLSVTRKQADGTAKVELFPHGDGVAQRLVGGLSDHVEAAYVEASLFPSVARRKRM
jgi:hypothetical protein